MYRALVPMVLSALGPSPSRGTAGRDYECEGFAEVGSESANC